MTVVVGDLAFDNVAYDGDADVLCLHVGDPAEAVEFGESPEGHALRYDAAGHLVGITIVNARWLLEQNEQVTITLPSQCSSTVPRWPPPSGGDDRAGKWARPRWPGALVVRTMCWF